MGIVSLKDYVEDEEELNALVKVSTVPDDEAQVHVISTSVAASSEVLKNTTTIPVLMVGVSLATSSILQQQRSLQDL